MTLDATLTERRKARPFTLFEIVSTLAEFWDCDGVKWRPLGYQQSDSKPGLRTNFEWHIGNRKEL
jgi:hypothetical protein